MPALRSRSPLSAERDRAYERWTREWRPPAPMTDKERQVKLAVEYELAARRAREAGNQEQAEKFAAKAREMELQMSGIDMNQGKAIADDFRKTAERITSELASLAQDDGRQPAWKATRRLALRRELDVARSQSEAAMGKWSAEVRADAERRYSDDPVGTAADESRRIANEMKAARLAKSAGDSKARAQALADRASELFQLGRHEECLVYAQAAEATGQPVTGAALAGQAAQTALDVQNPVRKAAIADRNQALVAEAVFHRTASALATQASLQDEKVARLIGDGDGASAARQRAALASVSAKVASERLLTHNETLGPPGPGRLLVDHVLAALMPRTMNAPTITSRPR